MVEAACSMATALVRHGQEPFPGPDNQSKMKCSVENAECVGLFTPTRCWVSRASLQASALRAITSVRLSAPPGGVTRRMATI
ncbi:hypothetical protein FSHL1_009534 [Fusarium sambucinum]